MREFLQLKQATLGAGLWGVGYYLATVGYQTTEQAIRNYVRTQGKYRKTIGKYKQLKLM